MAAKGEHPPSDFIEKGLPCWRDECGSSDAVARYIDQDGTRERLKCFSCGHTKFLDGPPQGRTYRSSGPVNQDVADTLATGQVRALTTRGLTQASCDRWDYRVRNSPHGWQQLAAYRDKMGTLVGLKIRSEDKQFSWVGSSKDQLFGRHLWGSGGKKVVITEGELDAISVSQAQDHMWPVVSVPNGASGAAKAIAANMEWLCSFDQVVLGFDMDEPGRKASEECARVLPAGKASIVKWSHGCKDANQMLLEGHSADITRCIWNAEAYRPDGILDARTLTEECLVPPTWGTPWPWDFLTNWTLGRRGGELYTLGSGIGMGKSDFTDEVVAATIAGAIRGSTREFAPEGCAIFGYEAGPKRTKLRIAGKLSQRRFLLPQDHPDCMWTQAELVAIMDRMDQSIWGLGGKLFILDSKGAADWEAVKDHCRFLHHAEGVTHFFVDPIGALVVDEEEERKFLDKATLEGHRLAEELNSKVYFVSHLTRPKDGPSHEEGGQVRLSQFRSSNGIGMYSDFVLGYERNQQAETPTERCVATIRMVKDRLLGNSTGETSRLFYDRINGTLDPAQEAVLEGMTDEDKALL